MNPTKIIKQIKYLGFFLLLFSINFSYANLVPRSSSSAFVTNASSITIDRPVGALTGDVLVVNLVMYGNYSPITANQKGWKLVDARPIGDQAFSAVFYKTILYDGVDLDFNPANYTFTVPAGSCTKIYGTISSFYGNNPLEKDLYDLEPMDIVQMKSGKPLTIPSITTKSDGATLLFLTQAVGSNVSFSNYQSKPSATITTSFNTLSTKSNESLHLGAAMYVQPTKGATGEFSVNMTNANFGGGIVLAFKKVEKSYRTVGDVYYADYRSLDAAFLDIQLSKLTGDIVLLLVANTTEPGNYGILGSGDKYGGFAYGNYKSIKIFPTVPNLTITASTTSAVIGLQGADNVTIDGRVMGQPTTLVNGKPIAFGFEPTPTDKPNAKSEDRPSLTIIQNGSGNGIFLNSSATNNTIQYCIIQTRGSQTALTSGIDISGDFYNELGTITTTNSQGAVVISPEIRTGNNKNTIKGCVFTGVYDSNSNGFVGYGAYGVSISSDTTYRDKENTVENCTFIDLFRHEMVRSAQLFALNAENCTFKKNNFTLSKDFNTTAAIQLSSIALESTINCKLEENTINFNDKKIIGTSGSEFLGIVLFSNKGAAVKGNTITNVHVQDNPSILTSYSVNGIWLNADQGVVCKNNTIKDLTCSNLSMANARANVLGIMVKNLSDYTYENNNVFPSTITTTKSVIQGNKINNLKCLGSENSTECGVAGINIYKSPLLEVIGNTISGLKTDVIPPSATPSQPQAPPTVYPTMPGILPIKMDVELTTKNTKEGKEILNPWVVMTTESLPGIDVTAIPTTPLYGSSGELLESQLYSWNKAYYWTLWYSDNPDICDVRHQDSWVVDKDPKKNGLPTGKKGALLFPKAIGTTTIYAESLDGHKTQFIVNVKEEQLLKVLNSTGASGSDIIGIADMDGLSDGITISDNTLTDFSNNDTNSDSVIDVIYTYSRSNVISNNISNIHNISYMSQSETNRGILIRKSGSVVSKNNISDLVQDSTLGDTRFDGKDSVLGIYFSLGLETDFVEISKNKITNLKVKSKNENNFILGIEADRGSVNCHNNIIELGDKLRTKKVNGKDEDDPVNCNISGILDQTGNLATSNYFNNTIKITGSAPGIQRQYGGFYTASLDIKNRASDAPVKVLNNILINQRKDTNTTNNWGLDNNGCFSFVRRDTTAVNSSTFNIDFNMYLNSKPIAGSGPAPDFAYDSQSHSVAYLYDEQKYAIAKNNKNAPKNGFYSLVDLKNVYPLYNINSVEKDSIALDCNYVPSHIIQGVSFSDPTNTNTDFHETDRTFYVMGAVEGTPTVYSIINAGPANAMVCRGSKPSDSFTVPIPPNYRLIRWEKSYDSTFSKKKPKIDYDKQVKDGTMNQTLAWVLKAEQDLAYENMLPVDDINNVTGTLTGEDIGEFKGFTDPITKNISFTSLYLRAVFKRITVCNAKEEYSSLIAIDAYPEPSEIVFAHGTQDMPKFCQGAKVSQLSIKLSTPAGSRFYEKSDSREVLKDTLSLKTGKYFVAPVGIGGCEGKRTPFWVTMEEPVDLPKSTKNVTAKLANYSSEIGPLYGSNGNLLVYASGTTPPPPTQKVCTGATLATLDPVPNLDSKKGDIIKWWSDPNSTTPLASNTVLSTKSYYVSKGETCDGIRAKINVVVNMIPAPPTVTTSQTLDVNKTIADLIPPPSDTIRWYPSIGTIVPKNSIATAPALLTAQQLNAIDPADSQLDNIPYLDKTVKLRTGTYYVCKVNSNGCESDRVEVTVTAPLLQEFCPNATAADLTPPPSDTYEWYDVATGGTPLASTTPVTTGTYYGLSKDPNLNCNSTVRDAVNITTIGEKALKFDGVDDYVSLPSTIDDVIGTGNFTIEMWIKPTTNAWLDNLPIISNKNWTKAYNQGWVLAQAGQELVFNINGPNGTSTSYVGWTAPNKVLTAGVWTHVAVVVDRSKSNASIYVNGNPMPIISQLSTNLSGVTGSVSTNLGFNVAQDGTGAYVKLTGNGSTSAPGMPWDGAIDELRIWKVARSQSEIQDNRCTFNQMSDPNLLINYKFNEANCTSTFDYVGNTTGTLINMDSSARISGATCSTVAVTGVTVSPATVSMAFGSTSQLTATIAPASATNQNVTWSSSDTSIATVSSTGLVTAVAAGIVNITATTTDGGITATCEVTVRPFCENALRFDGIDVYTDIPKTMDDAIDTSNFTIELWVKAYKNASNNAVISNKDRYVDANNISKKGWVLYQNGDDGFYFQMTDGTNHSYLCYFVVPHTALNLWNHLAIVVNRNNTEATVYVNGEPMILTNYWSPLSSLIGSVSTDLGTRLGSDFSSLSNFNFGYWKGEMDDLRIWRVARSSAQIKANMCTNLAINEPDLIANYNFNDCNGTVVEDRVGRFNGILKNSVDLDWVSSTACVPSAYVQSFTMDSTDTISVGSTKKLNITFLPTNATNKDLVWDRIGAGVSISDDGYITGLEEGTATIIAKTVDGGFRASCTVTITPATAIIPIQSIDMPTALTVFVNSKTRLPIIFNPSNTTFKSFLFNFPSGSSNLFTLGDEITYANHMNFIINSGGITGTENLTVASYDNPSITDVCAITVINTKIAVESISLPASATMFVGSTNYLTVNVNPIGAQNKEVVWESDDTSIATVGRDGRITAIKAGTVNIKAISVANATKTATCAVTVTAAPIVAVTGVTVSPAITSIVVGATSQLTATVTPANATNKNVTWTSSNTAVATVSSTGLVTAIAAGSTTITATTVDGGMTATGVVTVTTTPVNIALNKPATASTFEIENPVANGNDGDTTTRWAGTVSAGDDWWKVDLGAIANITGTEITWENAASLYKYIIEVSTDNVNWTMAVDKSNNTVSSEVMGDDFIASARYVRITVFEVGAWPSFYEFKVWGSFSNVAVTGVSVNPTTTSIVVGGTSQLAATVSPANATNQNVTWTSSAPSIATVSATGLVTAVAAGSATITATSSADATKTAISTVTVTAATVAVTGIAVSPTTTSLVVGGTSQLAATVSPANATNQNVTWTSSAPSIATVSATGLVTAVAAGSATITATSSADATKTAISTVTVTAATVAVTGVAVSPTTTSIVVGGTSQLAATVSPANATNQNVTWTSSAPSIATVSATGLVTAVAAGSATITATSSADATKTAISTVTVAPVTPTVSNVSYVQGATATALTATGTNLKWYTASTGGTGSTTAPVPSTTTVGTTSYWVSQTVNTIESARAQIDVTVTAATSTPTIVESRIKASSDDAEQSGVDGAVTVTGQNIQLVNDSGTGFGDQTVGLRFTSLNIPQGATISKAYIQFTTSIADNGATSLTIKGQAADNAVTFTNTTNNISNRATTTASVAWPNIVAWNTVDAATTAQQTPDLKSIIQEIVNRTGFSTTSAVSIIITGTGVRTSYAYDQSTTKAALLHIEYTTSSIVAVTGVSVNPTTTSIVVGGTSQLAATVSPANATNQNVTWTSSAPSIATVSSTGLVTAVAAGSATITATSSADATKTAISTVTVTDATVAVTGIAVSPTTTSLVVGGTSQLAATVSPANATNQNVTWTSSAPSIATVSATGLVTAVVAGSATITATSSADATKTAISTVTVAPVTPTVSNVSYVQGATATALTATGTNLKWYTASTGGTGSTTAPVPLTTTVGTTSYWVSQTVNTIESARAQIDVTVASGSSCENALNFASGVNDYVSLPATLDDPIATSDFTLEFWINPANLTQNDPAIISNSDWNIWGDLGWVVIQEGSNILFVISDGPNSYDATFTCPPASTWSHLAIVVKRNSNKIEVYVNGLLQTITSNGSLFDVTGSVSTNLGVKIAQDGTGNYWSSWNGKMDDLRIWKVARTQSEVANNQCSVISSSDTNLVANYRFNDCSGTTTLTDSKGLYNGTLTGASLPTWITSTTCSGSGAVLGVSFNYPIALVAPNSTIQLLAVVSPANATNKTLTWSSSNTAVATVNSSGVVTGVSVGTAVITATSVADSTKKATCTVTVSNNLIMNPGFEVAPISNYWGSSSTITQTTGSAIKTGAKGCTVTNNSHYGPAQDVSTRVIPLGLGSYYVEAWVKTTSGTSNMRIEMEVSDGVTSEYFGTSMTSVGTSWTKLSGVLNLGFTGTPKNIYWWIYSQGTGNYYVDDCMLVKGTTSASKFAQNTTTLAVDEFKQEKDGLMKLYPNPVTTELTIQMPEIHENETAQIYNINGSLIREFRILSNIQKVNVEDLPNEVYEIRFKESPGIIAKFIKK